MIVKYIVDKKTTAKLFLKEKGISDEIMKALKRGEGALLLNDEAILSNHEIRVGDELILVTPTTSSDVISTYQDFKILYEDAYLLIVDKKNNLASIPTRKHYDSSLANFVQSYYKRIGIASGIHFFNRLDFATSGIVVICKNQYVLSILQKSETIKKYLVLVEGALAGSGEIITGIEKDETSIIKRKINENDASAHTTYEVVREGSKRSLVIARLHTGKTHQLRLHFAHINHPIVGDSLYGKSNSDDLLYLHSYYFEFIHPITSKHLVIVSMPSWYDKSIQLN